jgi:hypothetical protein
MRADPVTVMERALALSKKLRALAGAGEAGCDDDGCLAVCGMIRDCSYRIQASAELEARRIERRARCAGWRAIGTRDRAAEGKLKTNREGDDETDDDVNGCDAGV